ncbi:MAG: lipopolysaccharide heptosyltransferase I [Gammaproteobacteria bacterium]|nr:lipopolysaccharide heptosyltransferase I [Gammaproteobacteria bacterium]MBQ0841192.1 lipopolysaccharide heptosyltransferase I [Gammaproteobacteria bacterium]
MNVLIVKLTSMGDLVQALPALSDAKKAYPEINFDWVVDESFAEIPRWHPAVRRTLTTAHRRWRATLGEVWKTGELGSFVKDLRSVHYDVVIDAQSNWKSALVTRLARGVKHGPDSRSVSEWVAHLAYNKHYAISRDQLAIDRWRQLFAQALDYPLPATPPDFSLSSRQWPPAPFELPTAPFLVFVQNASWPNKRWSDAHWCQLIERAGERGYEILLPWGSPTEKAQAEHIASAYDHCRVLPRLGLGELAGVLVSSAGAVCVDTGLAHVAAALDVPTVTLYGATDPHLIGATGGWARHLRATDYACAPCYKQHCDTGDYRGDNAQCMKTIAAADVLRALEELQALYQAAPQAPLIASDLSLAES